jgi:hypothetical protein
MLKPDPLSGDNGPNFFGHAWNTATYIVRHPEFGWLAFGGNISADAGKISVVPLDSFQTRLYVAPWDCGSPWMLASSSGLSWTRKLDRFVSVLRRLRSLRLAPAYAWSSQQLERVGWSIALRGRSSQSSEHSLSLLVSSLCGSS